MRLSVYQQIFTINVAKLILHATEKGFHLTFGEAYRTAEQQEIHIKNGRSKVAVSQHQKRLAVDFNLFKDGVYLPENHHYKFLAEFWQSLDSRNRAGFYWGWDGNHFEMNV